MKTLLSVVVAGLFAATSLSAIAQTKDVTTKSGGSVKAKDGSAVATKDIKDKPKGGELPKVEKREKAEKPAPTPVTTKGGGAVTSGDKKAVNK